MDPSAMSQEELKNIPEIKIQLQSMYRQFMESWAKEKIPALGNKTPLQAIKTPEGREMVATLLQQMERRAGVMGDKEFELKLIRDLRVRLGLA
jgi:hypothetical protein